MAKHRSRRLTFSDSILRRLILLPAVKQFHMFLRFHRDHAPLTNIAAESGLTVRAVSHFLAASRAQIGGIERVSAAAPPREVQGEVLQALDYDVDQRFGVHAYIRVDRGYRFDQREVESYFLAPSRLRYEIARAFWLQRLTDAEIAGCLGLTLFKVKDELRAVRRLATRNHPVQIQVTHQLHQRGNSHGNCTPDVAALHSGNSAPSLRARRDSSGGVAESGDRCG